MALLFHFTAPKSTVISSPKNKKLPFRSFLRE